MVWLRVVAFSCVVCVPLFAQGIFISPQRVLEQSDPNDANTAVHECAVAANGNKFVAMWMRGVNKSSRPCRYAVSTNGSVSWGSVSQLDASPPLGACFDPSVAGGADGSFRALFLFNDFQNPPPPPNSWSAEMGFGQSAFDDPVRFNTQLKVLDLTSIASAPGPVGQTYYYGGAFNAGVSPFRLTYNRWDTAWNNWTQITNADPNVADALGRIAGGTTSDLV